MRLIVFSDRNYLKVIENLLISVDRLLPGSKITYYMVDFFFSDFAKFQNIELDLKFYYNRGDYPNMNFLKPYILLRSIEDYNEEEKFIFLDSDITLGKRSSDILNAIDVKSFPTSPLGPFEYPYTYSDENGETKKFDHKKLMDFCGINHATMRYCQNCLIVYSPIHRDFIIDWSRLCSNKILLWKHKEYFPFQDETAFNVLLWKYGSTEDLGHVFVNTHKSSTYILIEENDDISEINIDNNPYEYCKASSSIFFYHGTKDFEENLKIQTYIYENSTDYPRITSHTS